MGFGLVGFWVYWYCTSGLVLNFVGGLGGFVVVVVLVGLCSSGFMYVWLVCWWVCYVLLLGLYVVGFGFGSVGFGWVWRVGGLACALSAVWYGLAGFDVVGIRLRVWWWLVACGFYLVGLDC